MAPFVPRQRKHRKTKKVSRGDSGHNDSNSNALEILPDSMKSKEEKKSALKDALRAKQPKMSSKKQKRLDKYIVSYVCSYSGER